MLVVVISVMKRSYISKWESLKDMWINWREDVRLLCWLNKDYLGKFKLHANTELRT